MMRAILGMMMAAALLPAQLPQGNEAGVAMGHLHFKTTDVEAHRNLWVTVLGGTPSKLGTRDVVLLPGVMVLWEKGEPGEQ